MSGDGRALDELAGGEPVADDGTGATIRRLARFLARTVDGRRAAVAAAVPGRIELVGKHVDYAGGRSLTCATRRGFVLVATARADRRLVLHDRRRRQRLVVTLDPDASVGAAVPRWARYPRALVSRLARDLPELLADAGVEIAFASDLPPSAGLSSSSALMIATWWALAWAAGRAGTGPPGALAEPERLAGYLGAAEAGRSFELTRRQANDAGISVDADTGGVGTRGGAQDHTAILCARAGQLLVARYAPERLERRIALPRELRLLVATSGVRARKAGGAQTAYNRLADEARSLAEAVARTTGSSFATVGAALDAGVDAASLRGAVAGSPPLARRLEQFLGEQRIVSRAAEALAAGDRAALGRLVDRSQARAETHLGNQVPETVFLVRTARELGAVAASAFGAGFGGAVWALADADRSARLRSAWEAAYTRRFPARAVRAAFLTEQAGPPARQLA